MPGAEQPFYHPYPGVLDEMATADGDIRPIWCALAKVLRRAPAEALELRRAKAEQYLRDSGVFYRQYGAGGSDERPWPLSPVPVLVDQADWDRLTPGLLQRAELLERLMADLYGENRMVAEGILPAELVANSPDWLRPLVGVKPRSGHYLHLLACELGRGVDGQWTVLADRIQAPSGVGYALENRVATTHAFSDLYGQANVHRLAGFFGDFRNSLFAQAASGDEGRVVILSPGPMNETYYEHAYIARYLGLTLVQGEDLMVEGGRLHLRTVAGPRPVDVLWRRLDSQYADPVELNPSSRIGTPGMVSALRAGGVTMVNALGCGVLESRAMMAYLPQICKALIGQDQMLPNIATAWLGDPDARVRIVTDPKETVIASALSTGLPFDPQAGSWLAGDLGPEELAARLEAEGAGLVAQEALRFSTTPILDNGQLVPRPMTLRVFLARGPKGWQVMPGGFARIGASPDPAAMAMQQGGSSADVWIVGREPVAQLSLVQAGAGPHRRAQNGALPARAADNLFWLGRYIERSEMAVRLMRALHMRRAEMGEASEGLIAASAQLIAHYGLDARQGIPEGLLHDLSTAVATAGRVRDRFSPDAWAALADLEKTARAMATRVTPGDDAARALSKLLRKLAGISGLVHENMYRALGWRFLTLGRLHERAMGMSAALAILADPAQAEGALDLAVEIGDSLLTHRRLYAGATTRATVLELLALDPDNPRSLRSQIDGLNCEIALLPGAQNGASPGPLLAAVMRMQVEIATETAEQLDSAALWRLYDRVATLTELLAKGWLS